VSEYRVDGLFLHGVTALMQGRAGERLLIPPLWEALVNDPVLSGVTLYAADGHPFEVSFLGGGRSSPGDAERSLGDAKSSEAARGREVFLFFARTAEHCVC
jgi:hypothetical protein